MTPINQPVDNSVADLEVLFNQITDNEIFRAAPMMRTLLSYLWQHRKEPMSEYAVAVDALGRRPNFDPKIDATVRVEIARLRRKLKEFYESQEESFPLQLSIPLGKHELHSVYTPSPASAAVALSAVPKVRQVHWALTVGLACSSIALGIICALLLFQTRGLKASDHWAPLPRFWQSFIGDRATSIVVPAPVHFFWPNQHIFVRDLSISDFSAWSSSPTLREFANKWGPPLLDQRFVMAVDVFAAERIQQYLQSHGRRVQLMGSTNLSVDYFADQNIIFIGGPRTMDRFEEPLAKSNFQMTPSNPTLIINKHPASGEPSEYRELIKSDQRRTTPGIVTLLPRTREGTRILLLVGRFSTALVSFLLSSEGLELVDQNWKQGGGPEAWEMVIQAEMQGDTILKVQPMGFHSIISN